MSSRVSYRAAMYAFPSTISARTPVEPASAACSPPHGPHASCHLSCTLCLALAVKLGMQTAVLVLRETAYAHIIVGRAMLTDTTTTPAARHKTQHLSSPIIPDTFKISLSHFK